jgi:hypothetical protein
MGECFNVGATLFALVFHCLIGTSNGKAFVLLFHLSRE